MLPHILMMPQKKFINGFIQNILNHVIDEDSRDELAFLLLQQKIERQFRDKAAWILQKKLNEKYKQDKENPEIVVRVEFGPDINPYLNNRVAVDMAVLLMNEDRTEYKKVLALIKFKHSSFFNREQWPFEEFVKDVYKMKTFSQVGEKLKGVDTYYVYTQACQDCAKESYKPVFAYWDRLQKNIEWNERGRRNERTQIAAILEDETEEIERYFAETKQNFLDPKKLSRKGYIINSAPTELKFDNTIVQLGSSFGYEFYLTAMIWKPDDLAKYDIKKGDKHD